MSGTLQVGGITLGTHNSGTGKVDITNAGATTVTTLNTTSIASGTLGSSVVVPASVGSSMVLIKKVDISGSPTSINFEDSATDVTFDTTYNNYFFIVNNVRPATSGKHFYVDGRTDGSDVNSVRGGGTLYYNNGSGSGNTTITFASNMFYMDGVNNQEDYGGVCMYFTLFEPADATKQTRALGNSLHHRDNAYTYIGSIGSDFRDRSKINGIRFHWQSNTAFVNVGSIAMYGIKNA